MLKRIGKDPSGQSESKAITAALGEIAYNNPVSSTKQMTGNLMGATGALETNLSVKSIQDCLVPPTFITADIEYDLDYVLINIIEDPWKLY